MADIVFLGPQRLQPTVNQTLESLCLNGQVCAVTAGWQEREGEVEELREHSRRDVVDLMLYNRAERLFTRLPELREAHRRRQTLLRDQQRAYRVRLFNALESMRRLSRLTGDERVRTSENRAALAALRTLDRHQLAAIGRIHSQFAEVQAPEQGDRQEIAEIVSSSCAVLIAGGHVAVLINRLRLFGLEALLRDKTIIAWSAGAMAVCENILLFHDRPPQGPGDAEVFEHGLGLVAGVVALPHARSRLLLDDRERVSRLARRMAPSHCMTLDPGSLLHWKDGRLARCRQSFRLMPRGRLKPPETETLQHEPATA